MLFNTQLNEQQFKIEGDTVFYPAINFSDKKLLEQNGYKYYDRAQERKISHYLCNNILYRKEFFIKHWRYISSNYTNHSSAESGNIDNRFFNILIKQKYSARIARIFIKLLERTLYSNSVITNIVVTETMMKADVVHIGYYSTEANINSSSVRVGGNLNERGVKSTISNLEVFNDLSLLENIKFKRILNNLNYPNKESKNIN